MKTVALYSTQNLISSQNIWKDYDGKYSLKFKNFGSWVGDFLSQEITEEVIVFILDYRDIITEDLIASINEEQENWEAIAKELYLPIANLIKKANKPTIIAEVSLGFKQIHPIKRGRLFFSEFKIQEWIHSQLISSIEKNQSCYYLDLDFEVANLGLKLFYDERNFYSARCRYSLTGLKLLSRIIFGFVSRIFEARKKVLVLDCDNTLWGGVVGEAGLEGIKIGQDGIGSAYLDFQKKIKRLKNQGVILAISSKNNFEDVKQVFDSHQGMHLKWKDFSAFQINWAEKSISLQKIAADLNVGLDSLVFWDDNPLEREVVQKSLPMIEVIDASSPQYQWPLQLDQCSFFSQFTTTSEDRKKSEQYQITSAFQAEYELSIDKTDYLRQIQLVPEVFEISKDNIDRAVQLCQKTNQFNVRTIRYEKSQILSMSQDPKYLVRLVNLKDKFGDHGLVALFIVKFDSHKAFLDTMLMSCRVLGRCLDSWILNYICDFARTKKIQTLEAEWILTEKNKLCESFFSNHAFDAVKFDSVKNVRFYNLSTAATSKNIEVFNGKVN